MEKYRLTPDNCIEGPNYITLFRCDGNSVSIPEEQIVRDGDVITLPLWLGSIGGLFPEYIIEED